MRGPCSCGVARCPGAPGCWMDQAVIDFQKELDLVARREMIEAECITCTMANIPAIGPTVFYKVNRTEALGHAKQGHDVRAVNPKRSRR